MPAFGPSSSRVGRNLAVVVLLLTCVAVVPVGVPSQNQPLAAVAESDQTAPAEPTGEVRPTETPDDAAPTEIPTQVEPTNVPPTEVPPTEVPAPTATEAPPATVLPTSAPAEPRAPTEESSPTTDSTELSRIAASPEADARVAEANPNANYGGSDVLRADGTAEKRVVSYLRFRIRGVGPVARAVLRLRVGANATADGPAVYGAANGWDEETVTWANRPPLTTGAIADAGELAGDGWAEFDVSALVAGDGTYAFAVVATSAGRVDFSSREASRHRPRLVVTPGTPTVPTVLTAVPAPTTTDPVLPTASPSATPAEAPSPTEPSGSSLGVAAADCVPTTRTFLAAADAMVYQASPSTNYGTGYELRARLQSGSQYESYLLFDVGGVTGPVTQAILSVTTAGYAGAGTSSAPDVRLANGGWTEPEITWNSRPGYAGIVAAGGRPWPVATAYQWDVTSAVPGNGSVFLALAPTVADTVTANSREQRSNPPTLTVSFGCGVMPTPTEAETATITATLIACTSATRSFVASADAFVSESSPLTSYGSGHELRAKSVAGQSIESYLAFTVAGLVDPVTSAVLRLTTATYSGANTVSAPDVRLVTGSWAESSITWASKPAYGAIVAPGGTVWGVAAPYAWDVTSVISGNGTVSLALIGNSPDQVAANSREQTGAGTAAKPTLTVTTCGGAQPPTVTPTPTSGDGAVTLVAVGDIACKAGEVPSSTRCQHQATSDLAVQANPDTVLVLGDVQYECAATSDFAASYDSSWGRLKAVTRPVIGNHEYNWGDGRNPPCPEVAMPSGAEGYWSYFGAAANPLDPACRARCQGYYSFDVGAWHVVVLNSMLCTGAINYSNQCYVGSPQEKWLKNDLRNRANQCVLAAWHHPLFSTGERAPGTKPLWDALYAAGAEVMLTGHLHRYEQWAPQDGTGAATQFGLRQFIAGTGGKNFHTWNGSFPANLEVVNDRAFGVLRLILRGDGYDWQFLPAAGGQLTTSGSAACHGAPPSAAGGESFLAAVPGDSVVWSVAALVGLLGAGRTRRRRGMVWAGIAACGVDPRGDPLFRCHAARRTSMRTLTRRIVAVWFAVSLALGGNRAVVAQDASPASEGIVAGVSAESLSIANLDVPTSGPGSIGFARTTLEPGGTVRLDATTGPSLHFVTEGTWTVRPAGDGAVSPATPASADGAPLEPDGEVVLDPGGRLLLPAGASVEVDNVGDVPAVSLSAEVTERMVAPDGNGVEWRPFGDPVAVPAGAMQVELTRLTLGRGATAAPHNTEGPELLDVRAGPVLLVLNPGQVRISRAEGGEENLSAGYDDPSITPEPDSAEGDDHEDGGMGADSAPPGTPLPGTAIGLRSGDAALLATGGTRVLRASDDAPAVILVVAVVPAGTAGTMPTPKSGS